MAVLETIRVKIGWLITALIAIALLSFIVDFNSLSSAVQTSSDKNTVGKINGKKIAYKDFQEQVEYQSSIAEMLSGASANSSDEQQKNIRNAAWQFFVDRDLFLKQARAAGIEVGKSELLDMTVGENISPVIAYDPVFGSPDGKADVAKIKEMIQNMENDQSGNLRMYWEYVQRTALTQQYYAKYASLFSSSDVLNNLSLKDITDGNNTSYSVDYVMVNFPFVKDSTIVVSDADIKKYYREHKEQFKQVANRDIEYAVFEVVPSENDHETAMKAVEDVYDEFASTDNVKNFLMRNSERQLANYWYKDGELKSINSEINDFVFNNGKGVSPIIKGDDVYYAVKVVSVKNIPDSVFVRHILIQNDNNVADSLFNVVKKNPSKFTQIAAMYSADKNPNVAVPGDLGWLTQSYMIPGMESVMTATVGQPFVLDTQYGRHIVLVSKATKAIAKKQIAILQKTAVPSKATMNEYYSKANSLATKAAGKYENLVAAAKEEGVYLRPMNVNEATAQYSGADRAKEVTRWIFGAKQGAVSNVISVNQNYLFVVAVKGIHKEGYATIAEAKSRIENTLYSQKLADKTAADIKEKTASCTTLAEAAEILGETVESKEGVSFSSMKMNENEPAFAGAVAGAEIGKLTGPVKGYMGVYLIQVKDSNKESFFTADDAKNFASQKNQYYMQMIVPAMLESTESVDHREKFY